MMTLNEMQFLFARLVAELLRKAVELGFEVTLGEAYRDPRWAKQLAATGAGSVNSLHCEKLAIDLNLFKQRDDGSFEYMSRTEEHAPLGAWWKQQHPLCRWGGDFSSRPDGNHYSLAYMGRA